MQSQNNSYSKLVAVLGEDIHAVQADSTYDLRVNRTIHEIDSFAVQYTPTIFQYNDQKHGFSLPPTILIHLITDNAKVIEIYTTPQLKLLNLHDAIKLIQYLNKTFADAGWIRNDECCQTTKINDLEKYFSNPNSYDTGISAWKSGNNNIGIDLERYLSVQEQKDRTEKPLFGSYPKFEDLYLVEVDINNYQI